MRVLVIGAGIFGTNIALELAKAKYKVDLAESDNDIMKHASKNNHNRLHLGYHYLRSQKTAEQSIEGLLSFLFYYGDSVLHSFPNYYAIAKEGSHTSATGFIDFCDSVGIDYDSEFPNPDIINRELIEESFKVPEPIFDYSILKKIISSRIEESNLKLHLNTSIIDLSYNSSKYIAKTKYWEKEYDVVINATYSNLNSINTLLGVKKRKIKYQDVIIPNFKFEHPPIGLTIMDGPFCSVMPRGKEKNTFLLYHVKNSVLSSEIKIDKPDSEVSHNPSYSLDIYTNSQKYYPFLKKAEHIGEYRTTRAIHENTDDARITELEQYVEFPNYFSVLSGKITTCVQISLAIKHTLQNKNQKKIKIL